MIYKCGDANFKYAWLDLIAQDPVHPSINPYTRITGNRDIYVIGEGNEPQFILSAKFGVTPATSVKEILSDVDCNDKINESRNVVTFYSIFRVPGSEHSKGKGGVAIHNVVDFLKMRGVKEFYTLSPIPFAKTNIQMTDNNIPSEGRIRTYLETKTGPVERFHLNNGATIGNINFNADESALRLDESWGIMVNYKYN